VPKKSNGKNTAQVIGFLGVGLDNQDGHHRMTRGEHFLLVGGSEETHDRMTDTAIHVTEELRKKSRPLHETTLEELVQLFHDAQQ
jgi:hypothetical protein